MVSQVWGHVQAAHEWGLDWDRWAACSTEARGVMLAYHRQKARMAAWEAQEQERKMMLARLRGNT